MITNDAKAGDALPAIEQGIDQDRIMAWARISGDFNRLHVDPAYAAETLFKGTIAHGPMSLGFLNQLLMECFGTEWFRGGQLLDVRFVAPIRPGDTVVVSGTIKEIHEKGGKAYAECDLFIDKAGGQRAVVGRAVSPLRENAS
jgi:3-hydroxybutyryl-CoA dehydratase